LNFVIEIVIILGDAVIMFFLLKLTSMMDQSFRQTANPVQKVRKKNMAHSYFFTHAFQ